MVAGIKFEKPVNFIDGLLIAELQKFETIGLPLTICGAQTPLRALLLSIHVIDEIGHALRRLVDIYRRNC